MAKNYKKLGTIWAVITLILALFIAFGFATANVALFWIIALFNLICGPFCFIMYLLEVKKGVFADEE